ncbi:methyltransferase domain-containing protein [Verrucomicrobia bacterium]|nr:methyltransferase domain-containing protein [Verrucomicrobiota bacterium]
MANKDILGVACGGGGSIGLLSTEPRSIIGSDNDPEVLKFDIKYYDLPNVRFRQIDPISMDIPDKSVDRVIFLNPLIIFHLLQIS